MRGRLAVAWACLLLPAWAEEDKTPKVKVSGVFVNGEDVLQAQAEMGPVGKWRFDGAEARVEKPLKADARGSFDTQIRWTGGSATWLAVDKSRKAGLLFELTDELIAKPMVIRLSPLVKARGRFTASHPGLKLAGASVTVTRLNPELVIGTGKFTEAAFTLPLPPGEYALDIRLAGAKPHRVEFKLAAGRAEVPLPNILLEPTVLSVSTGKILPAWNPPAEVRGAAPGIQLADYRGKWVLLEFWGSWCTSCVGWGVPNLVKTQKRLADRSDRFQIICFHDSTQSSLEEIDKILEKATGGAWTTATLPFPVLLDSKSKSTIADWGPGDLPWAILVDPEGRMVKAGHDAENYLLEALNNEGK